MKIYIKHYDKLTKEELYNIMKARIDVFVVEQNCPYHEIDEYDKKAYHFYIEEDGVLLAYLRLYQNEQVRIGRVLSLKRREGLATILLKEAINFTRKNLNEEKIVLEAQTYAKELYEKLGFKAISDEFIEDGIPHIRMEFDTKSCH